MPTYLLAEFERACTQAEAKVLHPALNTAPKDFGLATETEVLDFIGNGGLESPEFVSSKRWENNPNPANEILVDAYNFFTGPDYGYLAFMRGPTGMWLLKSLKKNDRPQPPKLPHFPEYFLKTGSEK